MPPTPDHPAGSPRSATPSEGHWEAAGRPALVVFVDRTEGPWLRWLKRGFRHCFAAVRQEQGLWLVCDPLKHRIETAVVEPARDLALAEAWLAMGHRVCLGWTRAVPPSRRPPVPGPLTCVAVVKRLIGLRCPGVITPHQLHRHLLSQLESPWADLRYRNLYLTLG